MQMLTNPQALSEGHTWLQKLRKAVCPQFRVYTHYIREAVRNGHYTYSELGTTEEEVLELAVGHAALATIHGFPHDFAVKHSLQCELQRVRGAHKPPLYATLVVDNKKALQEAA